MRIASLAIYWTVCMLALGICVCSGRAMAADNDCSALDPRASISTDQEVKAKGAADTAYKIAKIEGSVAGKLTTEIHSVQEGASPSDQALIQMRVLYLFCTATANATDMSAERKVQLLREMQTVVPAAQQRPLEKEERQPSVDLGATLQDSNWSVATYEQGVKGNFDQLPWTFHANNTVNAGTVWHGTWENQGNNKLKVDIVKGDDKDEFVVEFLSATEFVAWKDGQRYRRGLRR